MPRVIFTSRYLSHAPAARLSNLVQYIGSRKGVELNRAELTDAPVTEKQQALISQLSEEIPDVKELLEYSDFIRNPTVGNASELISTVVEQNIDLIEDRENFVRYMGMRPRVEKVGTHGLFTANDAERPLNEIVTEVSNHKGNVWSHVLSLRREDAVRLGFDNQAAFKTLLSNNLPALAESHKIPLANLRWYAAYHDEGHHPHIHFIVYSADPTGGFLTNGGIEKLRGTFASQIFKNELKCLYDAQNDVRNQLRNKAADTVQKLVAQMETGYCENPRLEQLLLDLHEQLKSVTGKKVYAYLPKSIKATVDTAVAELTGDDRIKQLYEKWCELEKDKYKNYTDKEPHLVPLEKQREFRTIKNAIIQAAAGMDQTLSDLEFEQVDSFISLPEPEPVEPVELDVPFWKQPGFKEYRAGRDLLESEPEQALDLLRESASLGFVTAEYLLGKTFLNGEVVEQDVQTAMKWLTSAAEKENPFAAFKLGKLYISGEYVTPDIRLAEKWLTVAAEQDSHFAQYALGKLYLDERLFQPQAALFWMHKAADHQNEYAQLKLGRLYLAGEVTRKDVPMAMQYFEQAAMQENHYAEYALGKLYLFGKEIPRDHEKALYWLERAASHENQYAKVMLERYSHSPSPALGAAVGLLQHLARMLKSRMDLTHRHLQGNRAESKLLAEIAQKKAMLGNRDGQRRQPKL